jgi:AcrR family transcriptional regulator
VQVGEASRARMVAAASQVLGEIGFRRMTIADVFGRAGCSRKTFHNHFQDREDCVLAAFDDAIERIAPGVVEAYEGKVRWRERIRGGLSAMLVSFDQEPALAWLCVVAALRAGPRVLARRRALFDRCIGAVSEGRGESRPGGEPHEVAAAGVVGAVFSIVHSHISEKRATPLIELLGPLMSIVVQPYLGAAAARREPARPAATSATVVPVLDRRVEAFEALDLRLTFRTLRVLDAIVAQPGASNRDVAGAADISDEGQTSRSLTRLQKRGLIENAGLGDTMGEVNAWRLTAKGREVVRASRTGRGVQVDGRVSAPHGNRGARLSVSDRLGDSGHG